MKPIRKYEIENTKPNNKNNSININTEIIDRDISNSITYPSVYKETNFIPEQIDKSQIIPSGEIKIIKNGVYSVYKYAQANVDINIEGEITQDQDGYLVLSPTGGGVGEITQDQDGYLVLSPTGTTYPIWQGGSY